MSKLPLVHEIKAKNINLESKDSIFLNATNMEVSITDVKFNSNITISKNLIIDGTLSITNSSFNISNIITDSVDSAINNGTLNIGKEKSNIINIGAHNAIQTINIGTGGINNTQINIGGIGDTVNIAGNLNYIQANILQIDDKTITLNRGSVGAGTARGAGIEIRDNNTNNSGYIIIGDDGKSIVIKAPEETQNAMIQLN